MSQTPLIEQVKNLADAFFEEIRSHRRHLHSHPELSFKEHETSAYLKGLIEREGIVVESNWAKTGLVASVIGLKPGNGRTIALRADMDALPIEELNDVPYCSQNKGVMHACGHDVHSASLLGALFIINELRSEFSGQVNFIFQPGEEVLPGGASMMIKEGLFTKHPSQAILGQHVMPELSTGKVGFRKGMYMASCDELYITVKGKGGHAALPHQLIDPIVISAQIILALQQIVSRRANSTIPTVLSIGDIHGYGATNVIPDKVEMKGTFRTYDEEWRAKAHQLLTDCCQQMAHSMGAEADVKIVKGYPFLKNDPGLTGFSIDKAIEYLGSENVVELEMRPTAEDFAWYSQEIPACFYRLGVGNISKGIAAPVHNAHFDIDEESLKIGMGLLAWLSLSRLEL